MTFQSYAQNFEDVMLWRIFQKKASGFYVDVGAQDPLSDSVTKAFYDAGWNGINIEPQQAFFAKLERDRKRDTNLCLLAGAHDGILTFYNVEDTGLSTTLKELAIAYRQEGKTVLEERVESLTLDTIFDKHAVLDVDFLKIDAEGAEAAVLDGLSFERVRPRVLVIEATEPNSVVPSHASWEPRLLEKDYLLAYRDGLNRYYIAKEHADLLRHFEYPPNVNDDFYPSALVAERAASQAVADELRAAIAHHVEIIERYERAVQSLNHTIREQAESLDVLRSVQAKLAATEADLSHVRSVHEWAVATKSWRLTEPFRQFGRFRMLAKASFASLLTRKREGETPQQMSSMPVLTKWIYERLKSKSKKH